MLPTSTNKALRITTDWIILGSFNIGVPLFSLWSYYSGTASRQVALITAAIVVVVGNLGVLLALRKQHQRTGEPWPRPLVPATVALAIISFTSTALGVSHLHHHNDYLDLAMSETPLSSIEPEQKRLVVELIRRRAANSRENDRYLAEAQAHPLNPQLYTPESFASKAIMESTMATLTKFMNIDLRYAETLQETMQDFRQKMAASDPAYLKSWDESQHEQDTAQAATIQAERDWFASVTSLYGYSENHASEIALKQERIAISSPTVLDSFNQQLSHSKDLQQTQLKLVAILVQAQQRAKQNLISQSGN